MTARVVMIGLSESHFEGGLFMNPWVCLAGLSGGCAHLCSMPVFSVSKRGCLRLIPMSEGPSKLTLALDILSALCSFLL